MLIPRPAHTVNADADHYGMADLAPFPGATMHYSRRADIERSQAGCFDPETMGGADATAMAAPAPTITLSQARTLAAFDSLSGTLSQVEAGAMGTALRVTPSADDAYRTGVHHIDIAFHGAAMVVHEDGSMDFHTREEMRDVLRDRLA